GLLDAARPGVGGGEDGEHAWLRAAPTVGAGKRTLGLLAPFDRLFPLRHRAVEVAKVGEPSGGLVIVRAQAQRLFGFGDSFLAAAENHLVKTSARVALRVVWVVGDRRLDLLERQVPSPGVVQRLGSGGTPRSARRLVRQSRLAQALDDARPLGLEGRI